MRVFGFTFFAFTLAFALSRSVTTATTPSDAGKPAATKQIAASTTAQPNNPAHSAKPVDFNRDVAPILSSNCFKCHGPDPGERKSGLRLDRRDKATGPAESGEAAIVPGKPDKSELIRRIFSADVDERMPPQSSNKKLTDAQKETLRRWIAEGAVYKVHWSFVAPKQAPLPSVKQAAWPKNPIDNFVLARLEAEGLRPSPEADRYTLVRRVYLDLIGLPPTVEEADSFVSDTASDAYERLVDRLLASPHYGERWARRWLDLARYADTNGYEKDRPRSIWPYRDWVIKSLNSDMPFDRFTIEQLAGDLLPKPTADDRVATGFHRNTMLNEEGGVDALEYRFHSLVDRVATTGTTWLGLTVACAQCHTHKFDPITHTDYYQFMAFFNNCEEPVMDVPDPAAAAKQKEIEANIARLTTELPEKFPVPDAQSWDSSSLKPQASSLTTAALAALRRHAALDQTFAAWERRESGGAVKWTVLRPTELKSSSAYLKLLDDNSVLAGGDITKSDTFDLTFPSDLKGITAIRLEALPADSLPMHGPGMAYYEGPFGDFALSKFALAADGKDQKFASAVADFATKDGAVVGAIDDNPQTVWMIDGAQGKPHVAVFMLAKPTGEAKELRIHMLFERYYSCDLGHFRISATTDPRAAKSTAMMPDVEAALATPAKDRTPAQRDVLLRQFLSVAPELADARKEIDNLRASIPKPATTLVMAERPADHLRAMHLRHRGEYLQPKEVVKPGVPEFLPPLPIGAPANRLTLARWIVSPENPLTARVTVNRQWGAFFGRGIVRTTQDFGSQGDPPSHPELLDWLAVEFMKRGWSMKQLDRLIVTSATYRQSSRVTPELLARDPQNTLLARGPRFRIEAEIIRDGALRAAGLLSPKIGGPSVFPPQPASITTDGSFGSLKWTPSAGEDRYRRSLYTYTKRTTPFAMLMTFDGPSGEACIARREVSNSPLQALTLLNDTMFLEAAQALGRELATAGGTDETRAAALFRRCLTRPPDKEELTLLVNFARRQRERLTKKELDAAKIAGSTEGNIIERATWTTVARSVLNLDETITKN